ncbi:elongator complex protein 3 [Thermotalea metallivorans]|uniref:Oxygen-independent coproporphyrinogen-III oxidase-like protein YqeR n=1 Tax=Thermotalea metallivorans TaxID=520762 RepID=A0A140LEN0_9FIRM|nr:radical SAM protein [Thermotalea metallivorans]KXG79005.1 Oxygen-independent coproporphyrinogen-III oxidase-like protein YqeR [Thermotalea metallivorans]
MGKNHYIIPIFVPHRGCPYDCIFCNQKKITGQNTDITAREVEEKIKQWLSTMASSKEKHVEIAFFGGSFTGIEIQKQEELLSIAFQWKRKGLVQDIRISTRPDYISREVMDFLIAYGVSIIELGVQSMDEAVLRASCRGHTPDDVIRAVEIMDDYDVKIGLQMMVGLPGDTWETINFTADAIISLQPDFVRIYPTLVIKNTMLEKMYMSGLYMPLSLEEAVDICKRLLLKFMKHDIAVIRIGLQPTEAVTIGKEVVAGPFHPAFRQLVESAILQDALGRFLTRHQIHHIPSMEIQVHPQHISSLVGQKKENIEWMRKRFFIWKIRIVGNADLPLGMMRILEGNQRTLSLNIREYMDHII